MSGKNNRGRKNALLSVYNKEGIVDFAKELLGLGFNIYASGGTARELSSAGIEVIDVASLVGGEAILGHRVVTLSRQIHAGLLARDIPEDILELERLGIPRIDLVCCDFYPLEEEISKKDSTPESVIEKTDIGGPAMIRSAAKGGRIVICDTCDRDKVTKWLKNEEKDQSFLTFLAAKAEYMVSKYCLTSAKYYGLGEFTGFIGKKVLTCKYGENPYQKPAAIYSRETRDPLALDKFKVVSGMDFSHNNACDLDRLLQTATHVARAFKASCREIPALAIAVKHGNPCGASHGSDQIGILKNMIIGDQRAIFGGLVMVNFQIGREEAEIILNHLMPEGKNRILDGVIAPAFNKDAFELLGKRAKCRLVINEALGQDYLAHLDDSHRFRCVRGGFLVQPNYTLVINFSKDSNIDKYGKLAREEERDLLLAWAIGCTSNSNAITLVKDSYLIGNGVGQQDRVGCCELAVKRARDAGHDTRGAVAYSDSFFPFKDGPAVLAEAGIKAIFASSGSIRDNEVIEFCQEKGIVLYMIPDKEGRGFFGH